ncbi:aldehyde dehydrogenase family protein [Hirsutella rhossiliensis]|uniref:Aldehyde dehydrogenase family domain-containing protein n=1 Tax=Hirsutella rhossiliensis TaxID=111463 RepID=A0A9P8SIJ4_9HYPO|nr:aldehyde dehydrogenase family domain-containing protein [Hirsutella rhossiliensis]KAH0964278.1 aldehyde dehydrogenase family domain-containing protein [Hirsutella rhossiliensis]
MSPASEQTASKPEQFDCLVHGESVPAQSGKRFDVVDPGTGNVWAACSDAAAQDVDGAVQSSHEAFQTYSKWTPKQRSKSLFQWHQLITEAKGDLAKVLTSETGKPLREADQEVDYALSFLWWFIGEAERIQGSSITSAVGGRRAIIIKQPVGVVAALVPWNFPLVLALRKMSAALAAGCTMVVKPSPETPVSALSLARLAVRAGFPAGAVNVLTTSLDGTPPVAEELCRHPLVRKVSFTGSTRVGKIIAGLCAQNLKGSTLELGGNCPFVVFDDANLARVLEQLMALKWRHAGQACISANRIYVQRGLHDKLVAALVEQASRLKMGYSLAEDTDFGPVTTPRGLDKAEAMAQDALSKGGKLELGTGKRMSDGGGGGYFMEPTILTGVTDDMLMSREEIFAPLAGVSVFDTEDEVVARANKTSMGLASYVFTKDVHRLWRMFEKLEAGMIGLNTGAGSSPETPFGGIKESGWGKESGKDVAVDEFLVTKCGTLTIEDHW